MPSTLLAQGISVGDTGLGTTANAGGYSAAGSLPTLIGNIIEVALGFVGLIVFAIILYAGFLWMTAQGNEEQVGKAKQMMSNAVIGFIIIVAAYALTSYVVTAVTGVSATQ